MTASLVEVLQQIVVGRQVNAGKFIFFNDLRYADNTVLVEGIEREIHNTTVHKILVKILLDDLLNKTVFRLGNYSLGAFPDKNNQILQETYFLDVQLFTFDSKRVHCDRMLFGVTDILATYILAKSLVRITSIDHNHIGILFPHLTYHAVHVETFTTARRTKTEEVRVICNLVLAFLSTDVYCNRDSLSVGIVYFQRCFFAMLNPFLVHKTCSCITKGQKTVVFRIGGITISRE